MSQPAAETLLDIFRTASLIKLVDERIRSLLMSGEIALSYYSPRGQEIVAAATAASLRPEDYVVTTYRGIHDQIAKGVPLRLLLAEYFGKVTGSCKGKGGPMHVTHPESGVMLTTGIVGSGLPIANGLALAAVLRGEQRVVVTNFGDGASNIGAFHEALNLASLWKLPVIFLCQNNEYAEHTSYANGTSCANVADRAVAYGIPGVTVDGNDPAAMYEAAADAIWSARAGNGPTLLEAKTFRFMGHFFGDDGSYIDEQIMADRMAKDPVPALRQRLIADGHADETALTAIEDAARQQLDDALEFARNSEYPDVSELGHDVYAEEVLV
ncbi:thiamine pyrophosphate-dependent dehydrogenase E1 component subunit alpha [Mycobacterium sp.]|uniref:thiamine pyrophosphate-dependent dehydrogenase E1 component subunit alpha n=1 Tax=Mycobacterium sp. TaxID=1785 RepID=UPI00120547A0|nr:thiamine pyrophosphate-dependent dehydrogenase E1 component subunit alpha [Mycobacterium sp.]TAM65105.1 MAG: thiamine pyrophosphate-dependent dehydrogenase E1 component subunit alpha [Mycobacterium sp.]